MTRLDDDLLTLLTESGLDDEPELGDLLAGLRDLAAGPAPQPSPAVDALLAGSGSARRGRHSRRGVLIGVLVLASIGTGVTAAAADPDLRAGAAGAVAAVVQVVHPRAQTASHRPAERVERAADPRAEASAVSERPAVPVLPVPARTAAAHGTTVGAAAHRAEGTPAGRGGGTGSAGSGSSGASHGSGAGGANAGGHGGRGGHRSGSDGGSDGTSGGGHSDDADSGSHAHGSDG